MRDVDLQGALLWDASLQGADLRGASLRGADLRHAHIGGADLRDTVIEDTNLVGVDFDVIKAGDWKKIRVAVAGAVPGGIPRLYWVPEAFRGSALTRIDAAEERTATTIAPKSALNVIYNDRCVGDCATHLSNLDRCKDDETCTARADKRTAEVACESDSLALGIAKRAITTGDGGVHLSKALLALDCGPVVGLPARMRFALHVQAENTAQ